MLQYRKVRTRWGMVTYFANHNKLIKLVLDSSCGIGIRRGGPACPPEKEGRHASLPLRLAEDLVAYFEGGRVEFDVECDLSGLSEFRRLVLSETRKIPYGQTASYKQIAKKIGKPDSSRAVGRALSSNPVPIVIPCHRVIRSDGTTGGYAGKPDSPLKQKLLELEKSNQ